MICFVIICAALSPVVPAVFGLLAAVFGPLAAYLVAKRQFSGKIETSDAKELWAESRAIREWSSRRVTELEDRNSALERRIAHLEDENAELHRRLGDTIPA